MISWIKSSKDNKSFRLFKGLGMDVYEIEDLEKTDEKIEDLINKKYTTIVVSNEVASFSQDIIKRYNKQDNVNIIITPGRRE